MEEEREEGQIIKALQIPAAVIVYCCKSSGRPMPFLRCPEQLSKVAAVTGPLDLFRVRRKTGLRSHSFSH